MKMQLSGTNIFIKNNPTARRYLYVGHGRASLGTMATDITELILISRGNMGYRPIILNRPFRSVGGNGLCLPWPLMEECEFFSAPKAGMRVFLIVSQSIKPPVSAGKINLNTHQTVSLQAMLQGALRIEPMGSGSMRQARHIKRLRCRFNCNGDRDTHNTAAGEQQSYPVGPLVSRADLVRDLLADPTLAAAPPGSAAARRDRHSKHDFEYGQSQTGGVRACASGCGHDAHMESPG